MGKTLPDVDEMPQGSAPWDYNMAFGMGHGMMQMPSPDPYALQQMLLLQHQQQQQLYQMQQMANAFSVSSHQPSMAMKTPPPTPPPAIHHSNSAPASLPMMTPTLIDQGQGQPWQQPPPFLSAGPLPTLPPHLMSLPPEYQQAYLAQVCQMQAQMQSQMQMQFAMARQTAESNIVALAASTAGSTVL